MNPEGKVHDWTDLPEDDVPEMAQVATGGNPEAAHAMVENLQACKGRGKIHWQQHQQQSLKSAGFLPKSAFKQVFADRRGIFENGESLAKCNNDNESYKNPLSRSKTLPNLLEPTPPPPPQVPARNLSSKFLVKAVKEDRLYNQTESLIKDCDQKCKIGPFQRIEEQRHWRPLRDFF